MSEATLKDLIQSDPSSKDTLETKVNDEHLYLPLRRSDFPDDKEFKKFIKSVERIVRGSIEYKEFISFCRETLNATKCSFTGWDFEETQDIELHHYPLTLFEIVQGVIEDKIFNGKEFCSFDIATEVIELHFNMKIGVVPLSGTLHKAYHNGVLKIPIEFVLGDYRYIPRTYNISSALVEKIEQAKEISINSQEYLPLWERFGLRSIEDMMRELPDIIDNDGISSSSLTVPKLG